LGIPLDYILAELVCAVGISSCYADHGHRYN